MLIKKEINPVTGEYQNEEGKRIALVRYFGNGRAFVSGEIEGTNKTFHHYISGRGYDTDNADNIQRMIDEKIYSVSIPHGQTIYDVAAKQKN